MAIVGMDEMRRVFAVIDELGIHREKVEVPLSPQGEGRVRLLPSGKIEIVLPETTPLDQWIAYLRQELDKMPVPRQKVEY